MDETTPKATRLVERVGASSPPGEKQAEANSLEDAGKGANSNGVHGAFLGNDLRNELNWLLVSGMTCDTWID